MRSNFTIISTLFFLLFSIFFQGCTLREDLPSPVASKVDMAFNINADGEPLEYGKDYVLNGDTFQFTLVKFYISDITMTNKEDEAFSIDDNYLLVEFPETEYSLGYYPPATYKNFKFGFGVDPSHNTENGSLAIPASSYDLNHPLSASNGMYWDWKPGYIFMKLEGRVDINGNGNYNDAGETFSIHPGLDQLYKIISFDKDFTLEADTEYKINVTMELMDILKDTDLTSEERNQHAISTDHPDYPESEEVMKNLPGAFSNFTINEAN